MQTIQVPLAEHSYPIHIGSDLLQQPELLAKYIHGQQVAIVTSETIAVQYARPLQSQLITFGKQVTLCVLPDGEQHKTLDTAKLIFDFLLKEQHQRDTTLIALGGGVVGDLTGFAAACYQRGVNYLHIPTTLLAQIDSAIGGKTAVNHCLGKNMIGAFHQPQAVIIDIETLTTLPRCQFNAGLAEMIKVALISNNDFFVWLEQHIEQLLQYTSNIVTQAITRACQLKVNLISDDVYDRHGQRALLNFGHTFGHGLEHCLGYGKWLHGEAVAVGIVIANAISQRLGWLTQSDTMRVHALLDHIKLPTSVPAQISADTLYMAMQCDKKKQNNTLPLVLLDTLGRAIVYHDAQRDLIINTISQIQQR